MDAKDNDQRIHEGRKAKKSMVRLRKWKVARVANSWEASRRLAKERLEKQAQECDTACQNLYTKLRLLSLSEEQTEVSKSIYAGCQRAQVHF